MHKVGDIALGLKLDKKGFERDLSSVTGLAKKAGTLIASAFAVKKLIDFNKKAIQLGSDLAEVQNVVDVAFPAMSKQIDDFAQKAATSYGLSETMAKKYIGTFGAMSKAFGFGQKEAYEMSTALTGLAGDVASFYNISQDEAFTKLKSVFTGETETLKELGVVMTQSALDQYAMANGFGKTTAAMTEQEKVALRYRFVMDQLSLASGDFTRTSDGWANQVRILKLQMESFMASVGQGLINIFSPILRWINVLLSKLMTLGNAFKAFTELITKKKSTKGSGIGQVAKDADSASSGLESAAGGADSLGKAADGAGSSIKNAAKEMKALMGFDKINKLDDLADSSGGGGGSGGSGGSGGGGSTNPQGADVDMGKLAEGDGLSEYSKGLQRVLDYLNRIKDAFADGFEVGLNGNSLAKTYANIENIKQAIIDIFTSKEVISAADTFARHTAFSLGRIVGSAASIGISIAENITGAVARYFEGNSDFIKESIAGWFRGATKLVDVAGDAAELMATVAEALKSEGAVKLTSAIVEIFTNSWLASKEIMTKIGSDIASAVIEPFAKNKERFKKIFEDIFGALGNVADSIAKSMTNLWDTIRKVYDEKIGPMWQSIESGLTKLVSKVSDVWDKYIGPVVSKIGSGFAEMWTNYVSPALQSFAHLIGDVAELIKVFWETTLQPVLSWLIEVFGPIVAALVDTWWGHLKSFFSAAAQMFKGAIDILRGVIEFLTGVFSGDWQKCFDGIKQMLEGFKEFILGLFMKIWAEIKVIFTPVILFFKTIFDAARDHINAAFETIGTWFSDKWTAIKNVFAIVPEWFKNIFNTAYEAVKNAFSGIAGFFSGIWNTIKSTFTHVGTMVGNAIGGAVRSVINGVLATVEGTINRGIGLLNGAIRVINKLPGVRIGGFSTVSLPRLAQGGYVKANTPQLAMIGDNMHYGEIVAPENKLLEMAKQAATLSQGGDNREVVQLLNQLLKAVMSLNLTLDGRKVTKEIVEMINNITVNTGECPLIV